MYVEALETMQEILLFHSLSPDNKFRAGLSFLMPILCSFIHFYEITLLC